MTSRAALDVDDLLKVVLILVIVWIALEIVGEVLSFFLAPLQPILGLAIVVLIVLYFLDRL